MKEPKVPVYSHPSSHACLRRKITSSSPNVALTSRMLFMPHAAARAASRINGAQIKPAFCNQTSLAAFWPV